MSMIPMPPEGIEASIFAQIIIQHWTDDIRKAKQEAEAVGENALRHNLDCAQFILEACSQLFDAATKGDYEYMSKVSEGISVVQVQGEPESAKDILQRIVCDLNVFFQSDKEKVESASFVIQGLYDGTVGVPAAQKQALAPPQMNRAARRQAAKRR